MEFTIRRVATTGHEVLDRNGQVVAWTIDEAWAELIVEALNRYEETVGEREA